MAKMRGKSEVTPVLNGNNDERFKTRYDIVSRHKNSLRDEFHAQEYAEKVLQAHDKYVSSMKEIREKLKLAQEGLARIDEKGMTNDIISVIEKIEKIQMMEISLTSAYTTELADYDSERLTSIREGGNDKDIFLAESIDTHIKSKNAEVKQIIAALDEDYNNLEKSIAQTKDYTPTNEDILLVRRKQNSILEQKKQQMLEYARFLEQTAKYRSEAIDPFKRLKEEEEALVREFAEEKEISAESPEETVAKRKKIASAFLNAEKKVHPKWEAFKALPIVSHLIAGGSFVKHKLDKKLEPFKSDVKAAYAVMKERNQIRKTWKNLSILDELHGNNKETGYVSRFKTIIANKQDDFSDNTEPMKEEPVSAKVDESFASVTDLPNDESKLDSVKLDSVKPNSVSEISEAESALVKSGSGTSSDTSAEQLSPEDIHATRVKRASNQAALKSFDESGLRQMINDYYWSDVSDTHDVLKDLESSGNVFGDLMQYTNRLKRVIGHFPDENLRKALTKRVDTAMTGIYQSKTSAEKKVLAAENRIKDSQAFLESLDDFETTDKQAGIQLS